jgi:hypothetical protein
MIILVGTIAIVAIHYARRPHHPRDWARERDPQGQYPECARLYTDECMEEALAQRTRASLDLANRALRLQAEAAARH